MKHYYRPLPPIDQDSANQKWPLDCMVGSYMIGSYIPLELQDYAVRSPQPADARDDNPGTDDSNSVWVSLLVVGLLLLIGGVAFIAGITYLAKAWTEETTPVNSPIHWNF